MSEANKTQVAGSHYRQDGKIPQHWDLVTLYRWDYFQAQITKYVMRWKDKHRTHAERVEDLKKARHVLDKYIEEAEKWDDHKSKSEPKLAGEILRVPHNFTVEGFYGDGTNLYQCKNCRQTYRLQPEFLGELGTHVCPAQQSKVSGPEPAGAATGAYTNQG